MKIKIKMECLVHVNNETSCFNSNILLYIIVISLLGRTILRLESKLF